MPDKGSRRADAVIGRIERAEGLDRPGYALGNALARPAELAGGTGQRVRNVLHGTRHGHPLHPLLVTIPIGTWTLALALDALSALGLARDRRLDHAADTALKAGAAGAVAAAAAGVADWQYTQGRDRRTGLVHGVVNTAALGLTVGSLALRRRGRRAEGRLVSGAGWAVMLAGAYLGGHLVYRRRVGVDHAEQSPEPRRFTPVQPAADLVEDAPRRVGVSDEAGRREIGVVLVRHRGRIHALNARCSHWGGPLDGGWVLGGGLVCPWHGSRFDLATGRPLDGPATCPQPRYEVRVQDGMVEIRRALGPGDEAVMPEAVMPEAVMPEDVAAAHDRQAGPPGGAVPFARTADAVLLEHHQLMRRLFERIEALPRPDPERRDLMRTLAGELEMHEAIEDEIFYPAVRPVSDDVPIAHAEHRQLADLLAMTLRLDTATSAFEEHLRALHRAVEHHAGAEERSMFHHAQRLGDARLRELGRALEDRLEALRTERFQKTWRTLKLSLLERA